MPYTVTRTISHELDEIEVEIDVSVSPAEPAAMGYPGCRAEATIDGLRVVGGINPEHQQAAEDWLNENHDDIAAEAMQEIRDI